MALGPKKKIFNFDKATINVDSIVEPDEPPKYPPYVHIKRAEGGYIVDLGGGEIDYPNREVVAETFEGVMKKVKSHLA